MTREERDAILLKYQRKIRAVIREAVRNQRFLRRDVDEIQAQVNLVLLREIPKAGPSNDIVAYIKAITITTVNNQWYEDRLIRVNPAVGNRVNRARRGLPPGRKGPVSALTMVRAWDALGKEVGRFLKEDYRGPVRPGDAFEHKIAAPYVDPVEALEPTPLRCSLNRSQVLHIRKLHSHLSHEQRFALDLWLDMAGTGRWTDREIGRLLGKTREEAKTIRTRAVLRLRFGLAGGRLNSSPTGLSSPLRRGRFGARGASSKPD